jgi:hypothetical protein
VVNRKNSITGKTTGMAKRAADLKGIKIDTGPLVPLMTEQSIQGSSFVRYYAGRIAEFIDAGFPENLIPRNKDAHSFRANGQPAEIQRDGGKLVLSLCWDCNGTAMRDNCHPVLSELKDILDAAIIPFVSRNFRSSEVNTEAIVNHPSFRGKFDCSGRYEFGGNFLAQFLSLVYQMQNMISCAEIAPIDREDAAEEPPIEGNVINIGLARKASTKGGKPA